MKSACGTVASSAEHASARGSFRSLIPSFFAENISATVPTTKPIRTMIPSTAPTVSMPIATSAAGSIPPPDPEPDSVERLPATMTFPTSSSSSDSASSVVTWERGGDFSSPLPGV
jgi:hypothetical protein